jgi:hypothetical protein
VWFYLDPSTPASVAEDRAERLVKAFVGRARGRVKPSRWPQDDEVPLSISWRRKLYASLSPLSGWVLKRHLGDGLPLDELARHLREELVALEAAREGLREVVRHAAAADAFPMDGWPEARIDAMLHRLACMADPDAPPLLEVIDGLHPEWVGKCLRCGRAYTLIRERVISRSDLIPPGRAARPRDEMRVVALHLHPDGRHHRRALATELPGRVFPVGEDMLVVSGDSLEDVWAVLEMAAEVGTPARDHLRGAVIRGDGRWSRHGIVGPLIERLDASVRSMAWGTVDGMGDLPPVLPEPPSARGAWVGVVGLALLAALVMSFVWAPTPPAVDHPLEVSASPGRDGVWVAFDVDDEAHVLVVRQRGEALELVLDASSPVQKIQMATGDGTYRMHTRGQAVLVASSSHAFEDVVKLLAHAQEDRAPLSALAASIRRAQPTSDVWTYVL